MPWENKSSPFFVAELSGNHNGSLGRALELVDAAANAGASAVKLQTFTAESMTLDCKSPLFTVSDSRSPWVGRTLFELYQEASLPLEWHQAIFERAQTNGIGCFSTPFDEAAVDFLEDLECPIYKISSFEINDLGLIRKAASTRKPLVISTGIATVDEITEAVEVARANGCIDITLLKCTSQYPAEPTEANLRTLSNMKDLFGTKIGISDHTMGIGVAVASIALGAIMVEKHFTLSRSDGGVDSSFSIEPSEYRSLVDECSNAFGALGVVKYPSRSEIKSNALRRRSIFASKPIKAGQRFGVDNIRKVRPGHGLSAKFFDEVIGREAAVDIDLGTPVSWGMVK